MQTTKPTASQRHSGMLSDQLAGMPTLGERIQVYLLPGQVHASAEACQIKTILGSCVAICLWDERRRFGGMNHFLLPTSRANEPASLRFADVAIPLLGKQLRALGCRFSDLRAKIFGGAAILQSMHSYASSLGAQNVTAALDWMERARIPVVAQETGGAKGRKLIFNTDDGVAWTRII